MIIAVTGTRGFPGVQGGVETHCEKLYTHLAETGCQVIVFTRKPYIKPDSKGFKRITFIPLSCPRNKYLEAIVHTFKCVVKARRLNPDLLHIHAIGPSVFAPLARVMGMRVVVTSHGPEYERKKWPLAAKLFLRFCEWSGMTFANEIIAISHTIAGDIKRKYGRDAIVLPNGVEVSERTDSDEALRKFGLHKMKYVLAVGRFVPEKGFHDLISAFVVMKNKDFNLVIVGDADHEDAYSRLLKKEAGLHDNIVLTGILRGRALGELYSHAGLFVLSSYYEGLPIVLLEAMSYGVSCIASDIPPNRNLLPDKQRYFRVGEVVSIADKMREFISKEWKEKDRQNQIHMIHERYNWKKIADDTLETYRRVVF
jgi:glycosyltransferase involved in cell wall biosynthesis